MKEQTEITITTTHNEGSEFSTTVNSDGLDIEVVAELIERALLGHGFHPDNVKEFFTNGQYIYT